MLWTSTACIPAVLSDPTDCGSEWAVDMIMHRDARRHDAISLRLSIGWSLAMRMVNAEGRWDDHEDKPG